MTTPPYGTVGGARMEQLGTIPTYGVMPMKIDPAFHLMRQGWCTQHMGRVGTYCMRSATITVTDPSGTRDVCTQHAHEYERYGPQQRITK